MNSSYALIIDLLGTAAFTISGIYAAMEKKLDLFGVLVIGFVTAIGGGTIRDVLIGNTPVSWMRDISTPLVILITSIVTILFKRLIKNLKITLFLFDSLGLGLFTIIGIQKGLVVGISPAICIALGTITGCFGGVIRDLLLRAIPVLFRKEIYATACIAGGIVYLLLRYLCNETVSETVAIGLVFGIRLLSFKYNWRLPEV